MERDVRSAKIFFRITRRSSFHGSCRGSGHGRPVPAHRWRDVGQLTRHAARATRPLTHGARNSQGTNPRTGGRRLEARSPYNVKPRQGLQPVRGRRSVSQDVSVTHSGDDLSPRRTTGTDTRLVLLWASPTSGCNFVLSAWSSCSMSSMEGLNILFFSFWGLGAFCYDMHILLLYHAVHVVVGKIHSPHSSRLFLHFRESRDCPRVLGSRRHEPTGFIELS